ncbi:zinc metallochaperone AztD [Nocardia thailandica]|uniref:Zinc metallochaperone AztD n=1 Tax=Nocardia thailandica TaxID=257275 RepID=A0ABW6PI70_9NOCA
MHIRSRASVAAALSIVSVLTLSACGGDSGAHDHPHTPGAEPIALTYDGGIYVLTGDTLAPVGQVSIDGFIRLNPAGDDHHLIVSTADRFRVFDAADAEFTGVDIAASKPGHVVRHAGRTVLFADGSGEVTLLDTATLGDDSPRRTTYRAAAPHHGVAVELANRELVVTLGTEEKRTGIAVLDADRHERTRNEDCPGVHGEATAANETVVIGCQTGALVYRDGVITKVTSPTPYGRIGNMAGSDASPVVLGDYKQDRDAELERPQRISLVDTVTGTLRLVDLGTSYSFRSLGRGPRGEALVLGTDGGLRVIDPGTGAVTRTIPVLGAWQEPLKWQAARPALFARGGDAYVTDPAAAQVHRIDLAEGKVVATATLDQAPNEISGVSAH